MISNTFLLKQASGLINWSTETIYACLFTSGAAFTKDSVYDVTYELPTAYGYTRFNKLVTGKTITLDDVNDQVVYDCDDISWAINGSTITDIRYCAFIDGNSGLIYIQDLLTDQIAGDGSSINITINSSGLFRTRQG